MKKKNAPLESNKVNAPISPSIPSTKFGSSSNRLCGESKRSATAPGQDPHCEYCWGLSETHLGRRTAMVRGANCIYATNSKCFPSARGLPYAVAEILSHGALQRGFSLFPGGSHDINWASPTFKYFLRTRCISTPVPSPAPVRTEKAAQSLPTA